MSKTDGLTSKGFEKLLALFSADRDEAGEKYEAARTGLQRFFRFKGCDDTATLADETMDRVAARLEAVEEIVKSNPIAYLLGFASNIVLEYRRKIVKEREYQENLHAPLASTDHETMETESGCLTECMGRLAQNEREMMISYFTAKGVEKQRRREILCKRLGCTAGSLYTQIHRLKLSLRGCIQDCLTKSL